MSRRYVLLLLVATSVAGLFLFARYRRERRLQMFRDAMDHCSYVQDFRRVFPDGTIRFGGVGHEIDPRVLRCSSVVCGDAEFHMCVYTRFDAVRGEVVFDTPRQLVLISREHDVSPELRPADWEHIVQEGQQWLRALLPPGVCHPEG